MKRIPLRWVLPIFHLAMDGALVAMLVSAANSEPELKRLIQLGQPIIDTPPNPAFRLLITSLPPASIAASFLVPGAFDAIGWFPIGWRWLSVFEALAMPLWFFFGLIADDRSTLRVWVAAFAVIRLGALFLVAATPQNFGAGVQELFWLCAMAYLFGAGLWWLVRRINFANRT